MNITQAPYHPSWTQFFESQKAQLEHIEQQLAALPMPIYPPEEKVFNAFLQTPLEQVKVVVLGQDPYHGEGEACGLSFSVEQGTKMPPSLRNIFKELTSDCGITRISTDLTDWASQGVLLINAILTVEKDRAGSHSQVGWDLFTNEVIRYIAAQNQPTLFLLWGNFAKKKRSLIAGPHNHIIEGVHPSPLSAYRGFFGSKPFSQINSWLQSQQLEPIAWEDYHG